MKKRTNYLEGSCREKSRGRRGVGNSAVSGRSPYSEAPISDCLLGTVLFRDMMCMCTEARTARGGGRGATFRPGSSTSIFLSFVVINFFVSSSTYAFRCSVMEAYVCSIPVSTTNSRY